MSQPLIHTSLKQARRQRDMAEMQRRRLSPQSLEYQLALIEVWRADAVVRAWEWLQGGDASAAREEFDEAEACDRMYSAWMAKHTAPPADAPGAFAAASVKFFDVA